MSIEHKAFLFDTKLYHNQIENVIKKCCKTGDVNIIKTYICNNYQQISNPYTGEPLDAEWENEMSNGNMQELFDFILTSCYEPNMDIGLEYAWDGVLDAIKELGITYNADKCVLGEALTYSGITIDPGMMGLGIVEHTEVTEIKNMLLKKQRSLENTELSDDVLYDIDEEELIDAYDNLCTIYKRAEKEKKGILFTF